MPLRRDNVAKLARFLGQFCREEEYMPLHRTGLFRLVEAACRRAEHKERLTTHRAELIDLLAEANFFARSSRACCIRDCDVQRAQDESRRRHGAPADEVDRAIADGAILIRTTARAVGQINGIALYDLAGICFGLPVRITVRVYSGRRGVVNIGQDARQPADKMIELLDDTDRLARYGKGGRQRVEQHYTWEKVVDSILLAIEQALGDG
jgi:predicted ATP-dependent protease